MIKAFNILHGYYNNINNFSLFPHIDATRGNKYKLYQSSVTKDDLKKHFFTNRVVSVWNSLPNVVVDLGSRLC